MATVASSSRSGLSPLPRIHGGPGGSPVMGAGRDARRHGRPACGWGGGGGEGGRGHEGGGGGGGGGGGAGRAGGGRAERGGPAGRACGGRAIVMGRRDAPARGPRAE